MNWSVTDFLKKNLTARLLKRTAAITAGLLVSYAALMTGLNRLNPSQKLQPQELQVVASIFGKDIDTSSLHRSPGRAVLYKDILDPGRLKGNLSLLFGKQNKKMPDIYATPDSYSRFVYSIAQQWQQQQGKFSAFAKADNHYSLTRASRFDSLPQAQQAAVLDDYARSFLHWSFLDVKHYNGADRNTPAADSLLLKVVEDKFPAAKKTRESKGLLITEGESQLLKSFFGQSFNTRSIRKIFNKEKVARVKDHGDEAPAYVSWDRKKANIYFNPNRETYVAQDYSKANIYAFGTFMHEVTHIWQLRTGQPSDAIDRYSYVITEDTKFSDLNNERQGALVRDYALLFLYPTQSYKPDFDKSADAGTTSAYSRIAHVIERQFPDARNARETMETKRTTVPEITPDPKDPNSLWKGIPLFSPDLFNGKTPAQRQAFPYKLPKQGL